MTSIADGALVDARYRLGEVLGIGGMGEVRRAWDTRLQRSVAIKLFRAHGDETAHRRFGEEARTLAMLSHPGLVPVYDAGRTEDGVSYLVLHLVDGETLRDRIDAGPLSPDAVRALGAQLAGTLAYVHGQDVMHRDIKPSNVLLDEDGLPYLADFGLARLGDATRMTTTGHIVGTAAYLAPEQVRGQDVDCATDVYALGLVLLECMTGKREYDGPDVEAAVARLNRPVRVPEHVPADLAALITRMTALTPRRRPSAAQVEHILQNRLPFPPPTLRCEPVPRAESGRRPRRKLLAGTAAALIAPAAALTWLVTKPPPPVDSSAPDTPAASTPTVPGLPPVTGPVPVVADAATTATPQQAAPLPVTEVPTTIVRTQAVQKQPTDKQPVKAGNGKTKTKAKAKAKTGPRD